MNRLKALFNNLPFSYIFTCIVISTVLSMASHDLVTQFLSKPPNTLLQSLGHYYFVAIFSIHIIQALSAITLYALINHHWNIRNFWLQIFLFALLLAVINENFLRRFLMDIIADQRNIAYEFIMVAIPAYITFIFVSWIIVVFFSKKEKAWWMSIITLMLAALAYQYLPDLVYSTLMTFIHLDQGGQFTQGSYGASVLIAIYVTYLLPVTGMYIAYIWTRESFPAYGRGVLYFFLLVGVHGQLLGIFQIATSQGNILYRILYYGSFWWELLIAAYTIAFFMEKRLSIQGLLRININPN